MTERIVACFCWHDQQTAAQRYLESAEKVREWAREIDGRQISWGADRFCISFDADRFADVLRGVLDVLRRRHSGSVGISRRALVSDHDDQLWGPGLSVAEALALSARSGEVLLDPSIEDVALGNVARVGVSEVTVLGERIEAAVLNCEAKSESGFLSPRALAAAEMGGELPEPVTVRRPSAQPSVGEPQVGVDRSEPTPRTLTEAMAEGTTSSTAHAHDDEPSDADAPEDAAEDRVTLPGSRRPSQAAETIAIDPFADATNPGLGQEVTAQVTAVTPQQIDDVAEAVDSELQRDSERRSSSEPLGDGEPPSSRPSRPSRRSPPSSRDSFTALVPDLPPAVGGMEDGHDDPSFEPPKEAVAADVVSAPTGNVASPERISAAPPKPSDRASASPRKPSGRPASPERISAAPPKPSQRPGRTNTSVPPPKPPGRGSRRPPRLGAEPRALASKVTVGEPADVEGVEITRGATEPQLETVVFESSIDALPLADEPAGAADAERQPREDVDGDALASSTDGSGNEKSEPLVDEADGDVATSASDNAELTHDSAAADFANEDSVAADSAADSPTAASSVVDHPDADEDSAAVDADPAEADADSAAADEDSAVADADPAVADADPADPGSAVDDAGALAAADSASAFESVDADSASADTAAADVEARDAHADSATESTNVDPASTVDAASNVDSEETDGVDAAASDVDQTDDSTSQLDIHDAVADADFDESSSLDRASMIEALRRNDVDALISIADHLRTEDRDSDLPARLEGMASLARGDVLHGLLYLRHAARASEGNPAPGGSAARLALAVGLLKAGRAEDAMIEALAALARARRAADERGENACVRLLRQLAVSSGYPELAERWATQRSAGSE